jgi:geranylgeranyl pyrophosphate synthase
MVAPLLARCEERLRAAVSGHAPEVGDPAAETLAAGGKRVRPLLVFCSAPRVAPAGLADTQENLLSAAVAVELVHMATLVHDDLLDGATMRRGRPTVVQSLGADRAVSTGDFLFARAFGELTRTDSPRAVSALAAAALDLSQGEIDQQRAAFDLSLSEEAYLARCRRKTAALFSVACRLGALMGGATAAAEARLAAFGENVGMAFQIFDDILDLAGAAELPRVLREALLQRRQRHRRRSYLHRGRLGRFRRQGRLHRHRPTPLRLPRRDLRRFLGADAPVHDGRPRRREHPAQSLRVEHRHRQS